MESFLALIIVANSSAREERSLQRTSKSIFWMSCKHSDRICPVAVDIRSDQWQPLNLTFLFTVFKHSLAGCYSNSIFGLPASNTTGPMVSNGIVSGGLVLMIQNTGGLVKCAGDDMRISNRKSIA
ncbi:hypothetical protein BJ912DRAFT_931500 [Pholiota molesta]|nr:hypothetical protein BJ912DRAFT_931500 [Pholiota molesta]